MNCQKNDMAWIDAEQNRGAIVQCVAIDAWWTAQAGEPYWEIRAAWPLTSTTTGLHVTEGYLPDAILRPIRPDPIPETVDNVEEITA